MTLRNFYFEEKVLTFGGNAKIQTFAITPVPDIIEHSGLVSYTHRSRLYQMEYSFEFKVVAGR